MYLCGCLVLLQGIDVDPAVNFDAISARLDGYSGDDITNICRCAFISACWVASAPAYSPILGWVHIVPRR